MHLCTTSNRLSLNRFVYFVYINRPLYILPRMSRPYRYRQSRALELTVQERAAVSQACSKAGFSSPLRLQIGDARPILVPRPLRAKILDVLRLASCGKTAEVSGLSPTLTTQQVAARLGVSRPHVVSLIESGALPGVKVGTHRRVRLEDLDAYQAGSAKRRGRALGALMKQARRLGLGY